MKHLSQWVASENNYHMGLNVRFELSQGYEESKSQHFDVGIFGLSWYHKVAHVVYRELCVSFFSNEDYTNYNCRDCQVQVQNLSYLGFGEERWPIG